MSRFSGWVRLGYLEVPMEGVLGVDAAIALHHFAEIPQRRLLAEDS